MGGTLTAKSHFPYELRLTIERRVLSLNMIAHQTSATKCTRYTFYGDLFMNAKFIAQKYAKFGMGIRSSCFNCENDHQYPKPHRIVAAVGKATSLSVGKVLQSIGVVIECTPPLVCI